MSETLVIKIGSAVLMRDGAHLDRQVFCGLLGEVAALAEAGHRVIVVSSGAIAIGRRQMKLSSRPSGGRSIPALQALAALGQSRLIRLYEDELSHYELQVAQLLLTREDFNDRKRYLNVRNALEAISDYGAIPVINENDSITTEEIRFGDNDQLAALVATLVQADRLFLLSDIEGFYTANPKLDPNATRIPSTQASDPALDEMICDIKDAQGFGSGGMRSKLDAARLAATTGIETAIAPGKSPGVLMRLLERHPGTGTRFIPEPGQDKVLPRKAWIGTSVAPQGKLWCDAGATQAVLAQGRSLLPKGMTKIEGDFGQGAVVELLDPDGKVFARGLSLYPADDLRTIAGKHSSNIQKLLGYHVLDVVVHRDDLALLIPGKPS